MTIRDDAGSMPLVSDGWRGCSWLAWLDDLVVLSSNNNKKKTLIYKYNSIQPFI